MGGPVNVTAIVPARDEADTIAATVTALRAIPQVSHVIVVDDGSRDATAAAARAAGAEVVAGRCAGKAAALEAGLDATHAGVPVLLIDADLAEDAGQAALLLKPVLDGEADLAVAAFPPAVRPGGFGLVKGLARWGVRRLGGGFEPSAPLSGQRALSSDAVQAVRPLAPGFGCEVAMTIRALRAGLRVVEVPTEMRHRETGRDLAGLAHRGRQFIDVARALLGEASRR